MPEESFEKIAQYYGICFPYLLYWATKSIAQARIKPYLEQQKITDVFQA